MTITSPTPKPTHHNSCPSSPAAIASSPPGSNRRAPPRHPAAVITGHAQNQKCQRLRAVRVAHNNNLDRTAEGRNRPPKHKVDQITRAATHSGQAKSVCHRPNEREKKKRTTASATAQHCRWGPRSRLCWVGWGGVHTVCLYVCNSSGIKSGRCSCAAGCRRLFWDDRILCLECGIRGTREYRMPPSRRRSE